MFTKKVIIASAIGVVAMTTASTAVAYAADVLAEQDYSASQSQTITTECTSGAYGQSSTCKASGSQSQSMSGRQIVYAQAAQVTGRTHTPVDTALTTEALALILGTGVSGVAAFAGYLKLS